MTAVRPVVLKLRTARLVEKADEDQGWVRVFYGEKVT